MAEQYTLEEWLGMMEEAGYTLEEGETKKINKEKKNTAIAAIGKDTTEVDPEDGYYDPHDDSDSVGHLTTGRNATNPSRRAFGTRIFMKRGGDVKRPKLSDTSPTKKPEQGSKHAELRDRVRQRRKKTTLEEWMGMMEEGKLSRLATGVGLGAAAMMGGAKDAEAQAKSEPAPTTTTRSWTSTMGRNSDGAPTPPKDSTSTQTSRDMQMAVDKAAFDLKSRGIDPRTVAGFKRDIKQNPDGTWSVTMKPNTENPPMDESRTLEEWIGMMEEAGYSLDERSAQAVANKAAKNAWVRSQGQQAAASGVFTNTNPRNPDDQAQIARSNLSMGRSAASHTGDKSTDLASANWRRRELHKMQQDLARRQQQNPGAQRMTPGQRHMGTVPTVQATSGMNASRDGTLGSKADRDTNDKYGFGNGTKDLVARQAATKARLGSDRESRGASVPGTVDFARDKQDAQEKARRAQAERNRQSKMAAESYTLEEWVSTLQEAGYDLEEGFMDKVRGVGSKIAAGVKKVGHAATDVLSGDKIGTSAARDARSAEVNKAYQARQDAEYEKTKQAYRAHQQAQKAAQPTSEAINENIVSRLQQLAGIKPTE